MAGGRNFGAKQVVTRFAILQNGPTDCDMKALWLGVAKDLKYF